MKNLKDTTALSTGVVEPNPAIPPIQTLALWIAPDAILVTGYQPLYCSNGYTKEN